MGAPLTTDSEGRLKIVTTQGASFAVQAFTATGNIVANGGKVVTFTGAASQTLTMPDANVGRRFEIWNIDTTDGVAIARGGSDTITDHLTTGATTFNIPAGAKAEFMCVASGVWLADYLTKVTKVDEWVPGAGTGNKSETGVGFRPKSIIFSMDTGANSNASRSHTGFVDAAGNENTQSTLGTGSDNNMYSSGTDCISTVDGSAAAVDLASFVSMDVDGFTLNFSANATASDWYYQAEA